MALGTSLSPFQMNCLFWKLTQGSSDEFRLPQTPKTVLFSPEWKKADLASGDVLLASETRLEISKGVALLCFPWDASTYCPGLFPFVIRLGQKPVKWQQLLDLR